MAIALVLAVMALAVSGSASAATTAAATTAAGQRPPLNVQLVALTYVGGAGDQGISKVGFLADGTIFGSSPKDLITVGYSADGTMCRGTKGNLDADTGTAGERNFAVKLVRKNPFDGSDWQVGYKQVLPLLQQPYLISPKGWKWWDWGADPPSKRELMADSRGIDIFFPAPGRFIVWCYRDGGNSVIARDPRDLDQPNKWVARGGGTASYMMLGDCATGQPLGGVHFPFRPGDACVDAAGRLYVTYAEGPADKDVLNLPGDNDCGFAIYDDQLAMLAMGRFGFGRANAIAVKGNLLVVGGHVGSGDSVDRKGNKKVGKSPGLLPVKNPSQPKPGTGSDGFLAILKLW